jgi:methylamine dehydrogenase heavy chain
VHGERTDLLTVYDYKNLSPIAEIVIPKKIEVLTFPTYIQLMGDGRHVAVFNMTPAASVTIVDIIDRALAGEISTPGCALIMAVGKNDFLMICGDGTMQLIQLDDDGAESNRARSKAFFSVEDDPVFDRPVAYNGGWLLVSHLGQVYHVTVDGDDIDITAPWSMLGAEDVEEKWRPGGGQMQAVHEGTGLLYVLMHQGGEYTHHEPGTEIWVYNIGAHRRIARIKLEGETDSIMVTQEAAPKLIFPDGEDSLVLYDALQMTHDRTIKDAGPRPSLLQDF